MFLCAICGEVSPPRTPATRIITHRRPKQYAFRFRANEFWRPDPSGKMKQHFTDDPGGAGWEIAREVLVWPGCAIAFGPQRE
jgi:hypothetical protein